jgi:hypothetical protein
VNAVRADQIKLLILVALVILAAVSGGGFFDQWFVH